jgi:hypothetical protein
VCGVAVNLLLATAAASPICAQRVSGRVVEEQTEQPIPYAMVRLIAADSSSSASALTNTGGHFILAAPAGNYRLQVDARGLGYAPFTSEVIRLEAGEVVNVVLRLTIKGIPLTGLEVIVRARDEPGRFGYARRRALGRGMFLNQDSIRLRHAAVTTDAFYNLPQISTWGAPPWVPTTHGIWTWSGGKCLQFYVDHFPRPTSRMSSFSLNVLIDVEDIRGIEIYRNISELPDELRTAMRMGDLWPIERHLRQSEPCGLVWIWTNRGW